MEKERANFFGRDAGDTQRLVPGLIPSDDHNGGLWDSEELREIFDAEAVSLAFNGRRGDAEF